MAVDIEARCDAIQAIVLGSALIKKAPPIAEWPEAIDDADLAIALTRPGAGDWTDPSMGALAREGTFLTDVFVMANQQGMIHEGIERTLDIISDVGARLSADPTLGGTVYNSTVKDRGLVILKLNEAEYRGTTFEIRVEEDA